MYFPFPFSVITFMGVRSSGPPILPAFGRVLTLLFLLSLSIGIACCWYSMGIAWAYDPRTTSFPILQCPKFFVNTATKGYADGPMCRITLANNGMNQQGVLDNPDCHMPPINSEDYIVCLIHGPCKSACNVAGTGRFCPDATLLEEPTPSDPGPDCDISLPGTDTFTTACYYIHWTPFCDSTFKVTPGAILAMRSLIAGTGVMLAVWVFAEITLWSAEKMVRQEAAEGRARQLQILPEVKRRLREHLEEVWNQAATSCYQEEDGGSIYTSYSGGSEWSGSEEVVSSRKTAINSRDPRKRFASMQWYRRVAQWKTLHSTKSRLYKTTVLARSVSLSLFFVIILIGAMYIIISVSPSQIPANADALSVLEGTARVLPLYTWMDGLIFLDILLDFGLFIIATASVSWPTRPVFASHMREQLGQLEKRTRSSVAGSSQRVFDDVLTISDNDSMESVLNQTMTIECCLLIACHESCLSIDKEESFVNTLKSALRVFPPNHIFVCDNGASITPADCTEMVARSVHPAINYLYIPEGNKTISFYWTNRYWIPFLEKHGRIPNFLYAVIIDDDVPLPSDLHIPYELLRENRNIKAVHYPITATSPDGKPGLMVRCQDIEYKLAAVHKYFQSTVSRVLSCHGAIALWEREALTATLMMHDCVFNGEDLHHGLSLLQLRDSSRIISCPQAIVPTYAPTSWRMLFRQRVKSWEVTSHKKTFSFLFELINPISFFHLPSVALKPYFLQELLAIILDWLRIFLLISLAFRDWLALALMTAIFTALMYIQVLVFQYVYLRRRKDLRVSVGGIIMFPFYRLSSLLFRVCALCQNILVYSHYRRGIFIRTREDEVKDLPATPPHPDVDWFTVWQPTAPTTRSRA